MCCVFVCSRPSSRLAASTCASQQKGENVDGRPSCPYDRKRRTSQCISRSVTLSATRICASSKLSLPALSNLDVAFMQLFSKCYLDKLNILDVSTSCTFDNEFDARIYWRYTSLTVAAAHWQRMRCTSFITTVESLSWAFHFQDRSIRHASSLALDRYSPYRRSSALAIRSQSNSEVTVVRWRRRRTPCVSTRVVTIPQSEYSPRSRTSLMMKSGISRLGRSSTGFSSQIGGFPGRPSLIRWNSP